MPLEAKTFYVNPLPFGPDNVMCVIKALLIVAAHSGQTDSDIDMVLGCTYTSPSQIIRWKYGARPLVHKPHISPVPEKRLNDLEKPLTPDTYNLNVRRLAEQCGILGRISTHDIRRGAAAEVSRLPGTVTQNVSAVASALGHSHRALLSGLTNNYIGDSETDFWALRHAGQTRIFRRDPLVSSIPFERSTITAQQIIDYRTANPSLVVHPDGTAVSESAIRSRLQKVAKRQWENELLKPSQPAESTMPQPQVRRGVVDPEVSLI